MNFMKSKKTHSRLKKHFKKSKNHFHYIRPAKVIRLRDIGKLIVKYPSQWHKDLSRQISKTFKRL